MQFSSHTLSVDLVLRLSRRFCCILFIGLIALWSACGGGGSSGGGGGGGGCGCGAGKTTQPPAQPTDITPINGETYYALNQLSGLQIEPNSAAPADHAIIQTRSFTSLGQRCAFSVLARGAGKS